MSPKRGIKLDQIDKFPDQVGLRGLGMLATGGTQFFGTTRHGNNWTNAQMNNTAGGSNGYLCAWPIPVPEPVTVDALRIYVATAADAGDDVRLGIYLGDGAGGRPATLHVSTGDLAVDSTGAKTSTFTAVLLSPGLYWFAICGVNIDGSTNPLFGGHTTNIPSAYFANQDITSNNADQHSWVKALGAVSALPDPYPSDAAWAGGNTIPGLIFVQARVA